MLSEVKDVFHVAPVPIAIVTSGKDFEYFLSRSYAVTSSQFLVPQHVAENASLNLA